MIPIEARDRVVFRNGDAQYVMPGFEGLVAGILSREKMGTLGAILTNPGGSISAIRPGVPEELAAAIIARVSRSPWDDLTELIWREFVPSLGDFGVSHSLGSADLSRVRRMIARVVDGYGDDSVREASTSRVLLSGQLLPLLSGVFGPLVGGIERSTRYVKWDERINGKYRYSQPNEIMQSRFAEGYVATMDSLFETYSQLWPSVWKYVEENHPNISGLSEVGYRQAIHAKVCDILRKLLPLGITTSYGLVASARTFSEVVLNLRASPIGEVRRMADEMARELLIVNPSFYQILESESENGRGWTAHQIHLRSLVKKTPQQSQGGWGFDSSVQLEVLNADYRQDLQRALGVDYGIEDGDVVEFLAAVGRGRTNRRHKLPEGLSNVIARVSLHDVSFSVLKDFLRHRNRVWLGEPSWEGMGYYVPHEIKEMGGEVLLAYTQAQQMAIDTYLEMVPELGAEARRMLTHGSLTDVNWTLTLGNLYWICELRSQAGGDIEYVRLAQQMWREAVREIPEIEHLGSFVNLGEVGLGRTGEIKRREARAQKN